MLVIALDVTEVFLRHGEAYEDRPDLVDHHERICRVRPHQVAFPDQQPPGPSRDRGADRRPLKVELGVRNRGGVGADRGLEGFAGGSFRFIVRLGHIVLSHELCVTGRIRHRTLRLRLVPGEHRLRLLECRLERAGVDLEQELSGRHVVALPERHTRQDPGHLRLDRRGLARLDRACPGQLIGYRALLGAGNGDRHAG